MILFGKIPRNIKQETKSTLGNENEGGIGNYLGIPKDISGYKWIEV